MKSHIAAGRQKLLERGLALKLASQQLQEAGCSLNGIIMACIQDGCVTRDSIIGTVPQHARCSHRQVAAVLDQCTGPQPDEHLCYRDDDKVYHLHHLRTPVTKRSRLRRKAQPVDLPSETY